MGIRAILLDFDGTSLQSDQIFISPRNMQALDLAMRRGVEIIPCTGRAADMFPPQIEADARIRYWVTSNGGRVVDRQTGEVIHESVLTPAQSAAICRLFEGRRIYAEIAAGGKIYMERAVSDNLGAYPIAPHHAWFLELKRQVPLDVPSEYFLRAGIGIEKVNLYGVPAQMQQPLLDALAATGLVTISEGAGKNVQFFPKGQDRNAAIRALIHRLGLTCDNVMALGDSVMDIPAITCAAVGVAMGNAPQSVRDAADYVAPRNDEDGVADAIAKYILGDSQSA